MIYNFIKRRLLLIKTFKIKKERRYFLCCIQIRFAYQFQGNSNHLQIMMNKVSNQKLQLFYLVHLIVFLSESLSNKFFNIQMMYKGRQKKLENISQRKTSTQLIPKTSLLHEHSNKIEQKLNQLKEQITQKKKMSNVDKNNTKNIQSEFKQFITRIGLSDYITCLEENGIDSLQILKEAKQSQLEEIGVAKGHALKIVVNLRKDEERSKKKSVLQEKSKIQSTFDHSTIKSVASVKEIKKVPQVYEMQTESIPLELNKKQFCLYCFSRSEKSFCGVNCENLYNSMFERYQKNLDNAEKNFIPKNQNDDKNEELEDEQQFIQNFDFLFTQQKAEIDSQEYSKIKSMISK